MKLEVERKKNFSLSLSRSLSEERGERRREPDLGYSQRMQSIQTNPLCVERNLKRRKKGSGGGAGGRERKRERKKGRQGR